MLQSGGIVAASSIAGCSYLGEPRYTTVFAGNLAEEKKILSIDVFDPEGSDRNDATWFSERVELEGRDGENSDTKILEQAFEANQAIVEVKLRGGFGPNSQFTYYPYCGDRGQDDILHIDISRDGGIRWDVACDGRDE